MVLDFSMTPPSPHEPNSLRLLSFDGGGASGLSSLIVLREFMKRVQSQTGLSEVPRPCELFDLIAGTGTGGLELRVEDAIESYQDIIREAFSESKLHLGETHRTANLENTITRIVKKHTGQTDTAMVQPGRCKTFVCAMQAENMTAGIPTLIRTYTAPVNEGPRCTIVQALRATSATTGYFKPITLDHLGVKITYVDGGLGANNPTAQILSEVARIFPDRGVSCVISIGAGQVHPVGLGSKDLGTSIARDSERVSQEMAQRFQYTANLYSRFNVNQGLQDIAATDWQRMSEIVMHSRQYMQMFEVDSKLNQAAKALAWPEVCVLATQLGGVIPPIETAKTFRSCPPPSPAFVGQEDALKKMEKAFWDGVEERHVFVLYGLGGGGKTQVALKFAQIHRNKFSEEFYIDATSVNTIEADLASLAAAKKAGKHYVIAIEWLANREGRWLLIFNNADDTSLHLRRYLPPCSHGDVLITTRNRQLISYAQGSHAHYQLSHMGTEDGKRLLLNMSGIAWDEANDKLAEAIVTELGCLALAITQAGAYIRVHECGLASYLDMYRVYRGELLEQYRYMTQKPDDYQWTVFTTWRVSLGKIGSRAIELLHLLSFMHHDQILEETFRRACVKAELEPMAVDNEYASAKDVVIGFLSEFRSLDGAWYRPAFLRLVTEIRSYSLIDFDASSGTYSIHPLVRYWIRTTIDDNQETEKRTTMLLALSITRDFEAQDYQYRVKLAPHIDALSTQHGSNPSIARKFALVYDEAGRFQAAKSLLEGAVEIDKRIYGPCHPDTLADTFELANAYHRGGELQAAERLHKIVLEGRIETLGDTHPDTYRARGYLAATYREQARLEEAVKIQLEVSEAAKTILGPEARESLLSQYALASTYMYQTQFQTAKDILTRLAEAQKRLLGPAHPDTLNSLELLADVLQSMSEFGDKLEEAEAIATQALEMRRQIFGEDHSRTLSCQAVLARIHFRQGQLDRARVTQEKIDSIQRRTLGELYVRTRAVRKDLALTYQSLGRFAEAEQVYRQVIEVGVQVFGPRHFDVVSNLVNLAKVCSLLGRQTEAEDMIAEKLAEISRIPINDPSTVVMLKINLAALHVKQRRWDEARVLVRYVVAALKPTQDPEYQLTRRDLHALNEVQETLRKEYFARCGYYLSSVFVVFLSLFLVYTQAL